MEKNDKYNEYLEEGMESANKLAWKYAKRNHELYLELLSEAYIGLVKALNTFDETKVNKFITYAGVCMSNQIRMYFRYINKHNKQIYLNEIVALDKNGGEMTLLQTLHDNQLDDIATQYEVKEIENFIMGNIEKIFPKEIHRKVFLLRKEGIYTQREIAEILNVSRSYISRIYYILNDKLIKFLNENNM